MSIELPPHVISYQSVTGKSLKFGDFQIVVQLILVLICLSAVSSNLRLQPVTGYHRELLILKPPFSSVTVHPLTMSAQQLPLTPLTLGHRLPEHLNDDGSGGNSAEENGETNGFLEDDSVTTGGLNREHYELREGSQIVL